MEFFSLALIGALALVYFNTSAQRARLALLAGYLQPFQIEKLMERLLEGYLRALDETDLGRQRAVWANLYAIERSLSEQFDRFVGSLEQAQPQPPRMAPVPFQALLADKLPRSLSFELVTMMRVHAQGIALCANHPDEENPDARKQRAFAMTAELLLMQHSCHWFCRSRALATARLMARHNTGYDQVLAAVTPATQQAYRKLIALH